MITMHIFRLQWRTDLWVLSLKGLLFSRDRPSDINSLEGLDGEGKVGGGVQMSVVVLHICYAIF